MKEYYVVTWNFRYDEGFTSLEKAKEFFESMVGEVSYLELKKVTCLPLGYYSTSIKIWHS